MARGGIVTPATAGGLPTRAPNRSWRSRTSRARRLDCTLTIVRGRGTTRRAESRAADTRSSSFPIAVDLLAGAPRFPYGSMPRASVSGPEPYDKLMLDINDRRSVYPKDALAEVLRFLIRHQLATFTDYRQDRGLRRSSGRRRRRRHPIGLGARNGERPTMISAGRPVVQLLSLRHQTIG